MPETQERMSDRMTEACWPVFEFLTNFVRQLKHGTVPAPEQVRYEGLSAIRDAEDLFRDDPALEKNWHDRVKPMLIYLIDYKMLNSEWEGRSYWFNNRFETDPQVLDHIEALGGEKFYEDCEEVQKEYEVAERRDRRDKDELGGLLNLYFVCLRLGFKGMYDGREQELADYTRRLFARLPAYGSTRAKEMFPDAYRHNQEVKVDYRLGMSLAMVLMVFGVIVVSSGIAFRVAWSNAVGEIRAKAEEMQNVPVGGVSEPAAAATSN